MPSWFQPIAGANPVTSFVDTARALLVDGTVARPLLWSAVWVVVVVATFAPLTVHHFRTLP
jgi:ABC-type polysaccharide/polyol phosphate export permease